MGRVTALIMVCLMVVSCRALAQTRSISTDQDYPNRPIRLIVPFAAGGPADFTARTIGAKLTAALRQPVVIDIRAGASGMIGTELVARSASDGYTLLLGSPTPLTIASLLRSKMPYDPIKDFVPVSLIVIIPQLLVANTALPVNSVKELVALAKSKPGQLNFGSGGEGSTPHLTMELLKALAGINMVHVPYKGSVPAMTDLIGGQIAIMFNTMEPSVLALVRNGKIKGLAVSSAQRSRAASDIPTVAEAGVAGFENVSWFAMYAAAKTPSEIITKLNTHISKILAQPELAQRFTTQGAEPAPGSPEALAEFMQLELARLSKIIASAGVKVK